MPRPLSAKMMWYEAVVDGRANGEHAAVRHGLHGVAREVPEDLADLVGVADDGEGRRRDLAADPVVRVSSGEFASRSRVSARLAATSNSTARFSCGRTKRRKSEIDLFSRSDSLSTIDISRCSCGVSDFEFFSTCTDPAMAASGLRIS